MNFGDSSVGYNYASNASIESLVDPLDAAGNDTTGGTDVMNATYSFSGVPNIGFAALEGEIGPGSVGETIDFVRFTDR
jgi:hypothetical protein